MVSLNHRDVVDELLVLPIPEALANALGVYVVWNQRAPRGDVGLAAEFDRTPQPWKLRRSIRAAPLPELTHVGEAEVVGCGRSDAVAKAPRPQIDGYMVTGLTTSITPTAPPNPGSCGGALELPHCQN